MFSKENMHLSNVTGRETPTKDKDTMQAEHSTSDNCDERIYSQA